MVNKAFFATFYFAYAIPGILLGFTPASVNKVFQDFLPELQTKISEIFIPVVSIPLFVNTQASVVVSLEHLKTTSIYIDAGNSGLFATDKNELQFLIPDISASFKFVWDIKSSPLNDLIKRGNGKLKIQKSLIEILISTKNKKGAYLNIKKAEIKIDSVDVLFDEPSGVYNWVLEAANRKIKSSVQSTFQQILKNYAEKIIRGNEVFILNSPVEISVSQISEPSFKPELLTFSLNGTASVKGKQYPINIPNEVELKYLSPKGFGLYISQYSVNTILLAEHLHNPITFSTDDFYLNITTDLIEPVFEGISKEFGNEEEVKINCYAVNAPYVAIKAALAGFDVNIECGFSVNDKNAVRLEFHVKGALTARLSLGAIFIDLEECRVEEVKVVKSNLSKDVKIEGIKGLINMSLHFWKEVVAQVIFPEGIELPEVFNLFVVDGSMEIEEGFFKIEGNLKYPEFKKISS